LNPALRSSAAHVFVESLLSPVLSTDDVHHLRRVLRLRATDRISISDGRGGWAIGVLAADDQVELLADVVREDAASPVTIAVGIPKGDRPEWMVQKLTELGVGTIAFMECARSVVRWDGERGERQLARLRRVAREAAMQSRRVWLPTIPPVQPFAAVAASPGAAVAEPGGGPLGASISTVLIGPEGGFTTDELACGAPLIDLSDQVLRVETAALVAAVLLTRSR